MCQWDHLQEFCPQIIVLVWLWPLILTNRAKWMCKTIIINQLVLWRHEPRSSPVSIETTSCRTQPIKGRSLISQIRRILLSCSDWKRRHFWRALCTILRTICTTRIIIGSSKARSSLKGPTLSSHLLSITRAISKWVTNSWLNLRIAHSSRS